MQKARGFTLAELLVYTAIFAIVAGLLTSIFYLVINSQKKTAVSTEVNQQLNFVLTTVQRLVGEASLVEAVYEGSNPSSTCETFCTLRLRTTDPAKDPTIISSNASGIYLQEGVSPQVLLTTDKVLVNHIRFTKHEIPGGHAVVEISTSFAYATTNPSFAVTRAIESAIARVNAATFDADLIPNQDNTFDIGQVGGSNLRWKNGRFSGDLTVGGQVTIQGGSPGAGKVLTSDVSGVGSWQAGAGAPAGQISFFDLASCPSGWTEATSARGRYLVALPSAGTLAGTAGTALSNLENRPVGQHTHSLNDPGHQHSIYYGGTFGWYIGGNNGLYAPSSNWGAGLYGPVTNTQTTGISINNTGTTAGTNAPYIQYLLCKKN